MKHFAHAVKFSSYSTAFFLLNGGIAIIFSFLRAGQYVSYDLADLNAIVASWVWFVCFFIASFVGLLGTPSKTNAVLASATWAIIFGFVLWGFLGLCQESMGTALREVVIPLWSGNMTTP